jgi:hypothetical protein
MQKSPQSCGESWWVRIDSNREDDDDVRFEGNRPWAAIAPNIVVSSMPVKESSGGVLDRDDEWIVVSGTQ